MHYHLSIFSLIATALAISLPNPISDEPRTPHVTFRSQIQHDTNLRYVANSGLCETTPGVNQYSGYIEVGQNMSMWFWFFEARNSPEDAPFTLWLTGGPGCSSMLGLFQENGPCGVNPDGRTTYLNPYSWNNLSNIIYFDQPVDAGFSHGTIAANSTDTAAPFVWKALQVVFESKLFSKYASREFIFATESYGGHWGPKFASYFHEQNILIARGEIEGECIIVGALMIGSGWVDPLIQWKSIYNFTVDAPGYGPLQPDYILEYIYDSLYSPDGCVAQANSCYAAGDSPESNQICYNASIYCSTNVTHPAGEGRDPYDIRQNTSQPFPPKYYMDFLSIPEVMEKIGAESNFSWCSWPAYDAVIDTGDSSRTFLPQLSKLANSGLRILIWHADADLLCNWLGGYDFVLAMDWYGKEAFRQTPLSNITMHGTPVAAVVNVDNFSFANVYGAGHEMIAFQPAVSLEIFRQIINKEPLHSV